MDRVKELQNKIDALHAEYLKKSAPFAKERDELTKIDSSKKMSAFVGKCFIYQNAQGDNDKWDLFWCVKGVIDACYIIVSFQKTNDGNLSFELKKDYPFGSRPPFLFDESVEIPMQRFVSELNKFSKKAGLVPDE